MAPSLGRIVHYTISATDAQEISRRRLAGGGIAGPIHHGNPVAEGDVFPMVITKVWGDPPNDTTAVNGQVMLDGNDLHWVTSVCVGSGPRTFAWPQKV